jgi:hypothetical protein
MNNFRFKIGDKVYNTITKRNGIVYQILLCSKNVIQYNVYYNDTYEWEYECNLISIVEYDLDTILNNISQNGINSLTKGEMDYLRKNKK